MPKMHNYLYASFLFGRIGASFNVRGVMLNKKFILIMFLITLTVLSIFQIVLDYTFEPGFKEVAAISKENDYLIYVEIEDKTMYLLKNGKCIKTYLIVSGKSGLPSPLGMWKIIEKSNWGEGFGGSWMRINVPWGQYGIHGSLPGDAMGIADSQGCIRMKNEEVAELYRIIPHGTPVIIVNGSFGAFGQGFAPIFSGDRGADVYAIQERLKELGFFNGWVSGIYENDLKYALRRFQKAKNLPITDVITKQDWEAMGFREFQ